MACVKETAPLNAVTAEDMDHKFVALAEAEGQKRFPQAFNDVIPALAEAKDHVFGVTEEGLHFVKSAEEPDRSRETRSPTSEK